MRARALTAAELSVSSAPFMMVPMLAFLAPHALLPTGRGALPRGALPRMSATEDRAAAKASLFSSISSFDEVRSRGGVNIDFGVKGGELDKDTRAPTNLADGGFYAVSEELGKAADDVLARVDELFPLNPTPDPTRFLGTNEGEKCPLHGCWSNIFTTAADATFSKDSERGDAKVGNEVDGRTGRVWNCIDFIAPEGATAPANPEQLRVQLAVRAVSPVRVALAFRLIKVRLTKFFFFPLFGRRLTLTLPVPGPFITRLLTLFSKKEVPQAYFDVLYLDDELRVHKTGQGAIFVQRRPQWGVQA